MVLRPPSSLAGPPRLEASVNVLDYELAQEKARTLGDLGQRVEQALARLRAFDAAHGSPDAPGREELLDAAAGRVWALMVQRELCGLRHWDAVVKSYGIPRAVLNRMGRTAAPKAGTAGS